MEIIIFKSKSQMTPSGERPLSSCQHLIRGQFCRRCGVYCFEGTPAFKTNLFDSYLNISGHKYLKNLRAKQFQQPGQPFAFSRFTFDHMQSICRRFGFCLETLALGVCLFGKTWAECKQNEEFWASACLYAASKAIQIDKNIPYITKYQRFADISSSQQLFERAEKKILEFLRFRVQFPTLVTFVHFLMTCGFIFKTDQLESTQVKSLEDELVTKMTQTLKEGRFVCNKPEDIALQLVKQVRAANGLNPLPRQLQRLFKIQQAPINKPLRSRNISINQNFLSRPLAKPLEKAKNESALTSMGSSSVTNKDQRQKLQRKRNVSQMRRSFKQNSFKPDPQFHQKILRNIRVQNLSVAKIPQDQITKHSDLARTEKLIPLRFLQNR